MPDLSPKEILTAAMNAQGMHDNALRAGTAAICGGEGGLKPVAEVGYAHTDNDRIRSIFGAARDMSDDELDEIKVDDAKFFEAMYGAETSAGRQLGNTEPGDGYKYRGRGQIQITGRANYTRYGAKSLHPEVVDNPELVNDPAIGAAMMIAYMLDRYHGGDFEAMKAAVGNSVGGPDEIKNELFAKYSASGEYDYVPGQADSQPQPPAPPTSPPPPPAPKPQLINLRPAIASFENATETLQFGLKAAGFYTGQVDRDFGPASRDALQRYKAAVAK